MSAYYRLKKHRQLKRLSERSISNDPPDKRPGTSSDFSNVSPNRQFINTELQGNFSGFTMRPGDINPNLSEFALVAEDRNSGTSSNSSSTHSLSLDCSRSSGYTCDSESPPNSPSSSNGSNRREGSPIEEENPRDILTFNQKLQTWAVTFRKNLTVKSIEGLLEVLREDHPDLPKSGATLLETKSNKNIRNMKSLHGTDGQFAYFGIEEELKDTIMDEFTEDVIRLLFGIDGIPLYNNSSEQFWPTLGKVLHEDYETEPFVIAIFSGDSKPDSADDYLEDFINELNYLIQNGVTVRGRHFKVEVAGFTCDTPARAFIKKCRGHGGFYSCERCETKGITVNKRRVFPSITSKLRNKRSFRKKTQKQHHLPGRSPLLDIIHFDPVKSMLLDSMHLLYLGITKWILQQLLGSTKKVNRKVKLSQRDRKRLKLRLEELSKHVPDEFQRKELNIENFAHWKATQFRFFLHYVGPIALYGILKKDIYDHFLLLVVACRILCDPELAETKANYARTLLIKFFQLLPTYYGSDSQVMNSHNLIHVADDVEHMHMNLTAYNAFPFENYLGKIKQKIKGRRRPVGQLVRRISEEKACPETARKKAIRRKKKIVTTPDITTEDEMDLQNITLYGTEINSLRDNRIVQLTTDEILLITKIRVAAGKIVVHGHLFEAVTDIFKFPCESKKIGMMKLDRLSRRETVIYVEIIKRKCVFFEIHNSTFAVTFLHNS